MTRALELADEYAYCKALIGVGVGADKAAKTDIHAAVRRCDAARAALVAEIERVEKEEKDATAAIVKLLRENDALKAEIERVERDAARYRYLRDGDAYEGWLPDYWNGRGKARHEFTFNSDIQDVDAAVDAAIAAEGSKT